MKKPKLDSVLSFLDREFPLRHLVGGCLLGWLLVAWRYNGLPPDLGTYGFWAAVIGPFFVPRRFLWIPLVGWGLYLLPFSLVQNKMAWMGVVFATGALCLIVAGIFSFRRERMEKRGLT
ncbi:MAG: hypothetical protein ABL962_05955 [Fimbriimonadaceae bacterium]